MTADNNKKVDIFDTTLRDGTQQEGIAFSMEDKLLIAQKLDEIGVDYIEGGYPLSNAKDEAFFKEIKKKKLRHSQIVAFGMTRRKNIKPQDDTCLNALLDSKAMTICIVGKAWDLQAKKVLNTTLEENINMIADSIKFLRKKRRKVIFDAEHFFDGYKNNPQYALKVLTAAAQAGAKTAVLCDTNGGTMPSEIKQIIEEIKNNLDMQIGIHAHNDTGLAVANSIAAVQAGARHVQVSMNGFGERTGGADLCTLCPNLSLKMNYKCLHKTGLKKLTEVSRYVYEMANLNPPLSQPYVGASSFAHKGGMHVHAVNKSPIFYEHIDPETVGNSRRIIVSELSGASNLLAKSEKLKLNKDTALVRKILKHIQNLENEGYQFETAEASFDLIVRRFLGHYHKFFELDHYRNVILKTDKNQPVSEASIKMKVNGKIEHHVAEGDGPVNALDSALRKALSNHFPQINQMQLVDYRVRVVNPRGATAAKVRVVIESSDQEHHWGTIGVSTNIIDASWQALIDSVEYKLLREEERTKKILTRISPE